MVNKSAEKKKVKKQVEEAIMQPVVEEEVIITDSITEEGDFETQTREFIDQLKPLLRIYKGKEKKELQEYINTIEALLSIG